MATGLVSREMMTSYIATGLLVRRADYWFRDLECVPDGDVGARHGGTTGDIT